MSNLKNETIADIMTEIVGREAACHQHVTDCNGLNAAAQAAEVGNDGATDDEDLPF